MGIILSVFILFIMINYSGSYSGVQSSLDRATIIKNFITDSRSVYFTGNAINFSDFDAFDFSGCTVEWMEEPQIACIMGDEKINSEYLLIPIFFNTDNTIIQRNLADFGWWRFYYITATSGKRILLNPLETDDETWDLMKDVVSHLPNTEGFSPRTTYSFCDGSEKIENLCSGQPCEQREFLSLLSRSHSGMEFTLCTSNLDERYRLVVLSRDCAPHMLDRGVCITPIENGAGRIVFLDNGAEYTYTDMADVAAAVIGRDDRDLFGRTEGENFFLYKRKLFLRMISLAADEMAARSGLILDNLPSDREQCRDSYLSFRESMELVSQMTELDINQPVIAQAFGNELDNAGSIWQELINNGCENSQGI